MCAVAGGIGNLCRVAFTVTLRVQEIAIRMALGAERGKIARMVLAGGVKLALLDAGWAWRAQSRCHGLWSSFLFDVSATDPWLYVLSAAVMLLLTMAASALPAARAAATEPIGALRAV